MSNLNESQAHPLHDKTRIVIRGATNHYHPPFSRSILMATRDRGIKYIVVSTSMASQALRTYLERFRQKGRDAEIEPLHPFQGDEDTLEGALTGKLNPSRQDLAQAFHVLAQVMRRMHAAPGRILVLCQLGRNRSFTTAFIYYICFHAAPNRTVSQALGDFKAWEGVSYDVTLQQDGFQRLDETKPWLPWMQSLARIFHDPLTKKISRARVQSLLAA